MAGAAQFRWHSAGSVGQHEHQHPFYPSSVTAMGFQFELVWADRLYGESKVNFVNGLDESKLPYSRLVLHTPDLHITPMP